MSEHLGNLVVVIVSRQTCFSCNMIIFPFQTAIFEGRKNTIFRHTQILVMALFFQMFRWFRWILNFVFPHMNIIMDLQQLRFLSLAATPCAGPMLGLNCLVIYGMSCPLALKKALSQNLGGGPKKIASLIKKLTFQTMTLGSLPHLWTNPHHHMCCLYPMISL